MIFGVALSFIFCTWKIVGPINSKVGEFSSKPLNQNQPTDLNDEESRVLAINEAAVYWLAAETTCAAAILLESDTLKLFKSLSLWYCALCNNKNNNNTRSRLKYKNRFMTFILSILALTMLN